MKTIFFDLDGTLAEWKDGTPFPDLKKDGYFYELRPEPLAEYANGLARSGRARVCILSSYLTDCRALPDKDAWCDRFCPDIPRENRIFVPDGEPKCRHAEAFLGRELTEDDILVDDFSKNCNLWRAAGGFAVKWLNGINGNGNGYDGPRHMWSAELEQYL